jgi:cell division septation protein DedD
VNLPLIGTVHVAPVPAGAPAATLLAADDPDEMKSVIDVLTQTRKSLTLRSLFLTGFPHDPEFFAAGVALARQWSRQGLKVAVVDLDYRHPTVIRPLPTPNEGLVDALEYGCSFQRIAWELVSDALWLVGPGSHPPDERRFPDHPDWTRVMRIFSARVDVALYLAPFLDKKGFTGALSKRMDGVILAACVRRSSRAALRDAFLELWGSDAPMIGCFGIEAPFDPTPHGETQIAGESWAPERAVPIVPPAVTSPAPLPTQAAPRKEAARSVAAPKADSGEVAPQALVARLSDEVRRGHVPRSTSPGSRGLFLAALVLFLAGVGAIATYQVMHHAASRPPAPAETLPAGTEPVMPADVGTPAASVPAVGGPAESSPGTSLTPAPDATSPEGSTPAPAPAPPVAALEKKNFEVHVASFTTDTMAKNLVKRLRDKGLDAWYAKATTQPNWYRIFIGHYATHEEAVRQARTLLDRGLVEHAIAYPDHAR